MFRRVGLSIEKIASATCANTTECLMILLRDSAERLISNCSDSDSGISG